jgi:acyl carrier protein
LASVTEASLDKFNGILTRTLGLSVDQIDDDLTPGDVDTWDSFNGLVLASELESTFSLTFTTEEVTGIKNVGDMKQVLRSRGIGI